jgi:hypothetical protein
MTGPSGKSNTNGNSKRHATQQSDQMTLAERLRQTLAEQLDAISKLPAALLPEAFSGKL